MFKRKRQNDATEDMGTADMGIIKLEVSLPEAVKAIEEFKKNRFRALEAIGAEIREVVSGVVNQLLHTEMTLFLGKSDQTGNKRNGYEERNYALKGVGSIQLRMPTDRRREFKSSIIPHMDETHRMSIS